jgi:hypothetical protein
MEERVCWKGLALWRGGKTSTARPPIHKPVVVIGGTRAVVKKETRKGRTKK